MDRVAYCVLYRQSLVFWYLFFWSKCVQYLHSIIPKSHLGYLLTRVMEMLTGQKCSPDE